MRAERLRIKSKWWYALSATSQILISARARKNGAEGGGRHAFFACFARCNCCPRHQTRRTNAPQPRGSASSQTLHTTHARGTHGGRTGGRRRTTEGRTGRKDGAGIILRELSHGMLTLARARSRARPLPPQLSLSQSISPFPLFMHFGFSRVLNDGAFANYRPTETLHGQSDTTTNLQAHILIRLLLTMFSFLRVWISFIPP